MKDSSKTIEELTARLREANLENSHLQSRNELLQKVQAWLHELRLLYGCQVRATSYKVRAYQSNTALDWKFWGSLDPVA